MSSLDYLDLCRLCLVKDEVSVPIFEGEGDVRQIFLKITACLPVKVAREDKLPKKICKECVCKVECFYSFCNTTANSEKQLLQLLGDVQMEDDKQNYIGNVLSSNEMRADENSKNNRLEDTVMHQVGEHQSSMNIMDNIMDMPMMISGTTQQITSVPMDNTGESVQNVSVAGPSTQMAHEQVHINQNQSDTPMQQEEEEESSEEDENFEEECDADEGLPVKEESEEDPNNRRAVEPTTFVNVSLACEEAGPSGLQQQKITELPDNMVIPQTEDVDPKTGCFVSKVVLLPSRKRTATGECKHVFVQEVVRAEVVTPGSKMDSNKPRDVTRLRLMHCKLCGESYVYSQGLSETEESISENERLMCEICGMTFLTMLKLMKHQEDHASEPRFTCDTCDFATPNRKDLISHENFHSLEALAAYKYECEVCGEKFQSKGNCQVHLLSHAPDEPYKCDDCGASFRHRQGLRLHAKLHQPDYVPPQRKHHCEVCRKRFSRKQVLLVHMKTHRTSAEPQNEYVCKICGKVVSSKTYLAVHQRKHTGEKPHVCDVCGKSFISQNYLSVHRRTHTGEKPHQCVYCKKRFTQRTTLVVHLRGHTGDRPYPCTHCDKSFASKTMLNSHLKIHAKQNAQPTETMETSQ